MPQFKKSAAGKAVPADLFSTGLPSVWKENAKSEKCSQVKNNKQSYVYLLKTLGVTFESTSRRFLSEFDDT